MSPRFWGRLILIPFKTAWAVGDDVQRAIDRLAEQFPNAVMVLTPVHASWLNQVEGYFSIIQRKALSPNDFTDLAVVEQLSLPQNRGDMRYEE